MKAFQHNAIQWVINTLLLHKHHTLTCKIIWCSGVQTENNRDAIGCITNAGPQ